MELTFFLILHRYRFFSENLMLNEPVLINQRFTMRGSIF
uniref:Uncharacterized protein n=1 Tax=Podoviridae sp. cttxo15 TaxID=2826584 RepID=A0A8S5N1G9_9CAUD|nr:MAG TPA: hypothetical protein [Podoviridae sp. cttxo15]